MKNFGAVAQSLAISFQPEQEDLIRVAGIGQSAQSSHCASAIVQGVGGDRQLRLGKRNELMLQVGDR